MTALDDQIGGQHYKKFKIQPVEFGHANGLNFLQVNVIKYVCRHKFENKAEDLDKAIHYLKMYKELEYGKKENIPSDFGARVVADQKRLDDKLEVVDLLNDAEMRDVKCVHCGKIVSYNDSDPGNFVICPWCDYPYTLVKRDCETWSLIFRSGQ